ncbi:nucleotidyltransferase family protein [Sphingobacterium zeae]|uniref:nucleotidyltransferase family protein n=1 Tax=Sphingobacterium zeae TaxID=1776859 RepID=UPI0036074CFF
MRNRLKDIFFQLLRIGLWGKGQLVLTKPMTADDWDTIRAYAANHTVDGIIYDSFPFLEENQLPPLVLRLKWAARIDQIERRNEKMNQVIAEQFVLFSKIGLKPILLKGQGIAASYRIPSHRSCGDIDWYFDDNGYAEARKYLKENAVKFRDTAGFSLDYEWGNIDTEHHKKIFDIRSPFKLSYLRMLKDHYKQQEQMLSIGNESIRLLAPELQLLQVNGHILKHMISFGIGLRQICDSARLYHTTHTTINKEDLQNMYTKSGIIDWMHLLHKILVEYLGLPIDEIPFPYPNNLDAEWMMNEIWYSGNFGFHDERFEDGKIINAISSLPDGPKRLWKNFNRYFRFAPQEVFFFTLVHSYSRFIGKDSD